MARHKGLCTGLGGLWGGMAHGAASNGLWARGQMFRLSWPPKTGEGIFRNRPAKPLVAAVLYGHWLNMGASAMPSGMGGIIPLKMGPVSVPAASDALPLLWRTSPLQQAVVLECHDEQRDAHRR